MLSCKLELIDNTKGVNPGTGSGSGTTTCVNATGVTAIAPSAQNPLSINLDLTGDLKDITKVDWSVSLNNIEQYQSSQSASPFSTSATLKGEGTFVVTAKVLNKCGSTYSLTKDYIYVAPKICTKVQSITVSNTSTSTQSVISLALSATTDIAKVDWSISQGGLKVTETSSLTTPYGVTNLNLTTDGKFDIQAKITTTCGDSYTLTNTYYYVKPIETVLVSGSTYSMGRENGADDEKPVHSVSITSFYIGKYEVTVEEFNKFVEATSYLTDAERAKYSFIYTQPGQAPVQKSGITWRYDSEGILHTNLKNNTNPALYLSYYDAIAFCDWMTNTTKKTYRLPTEAEWEYAARGGRLSTGKAYAGSNDPNEVAWYNGNSSLRVRPVGLKKANELGVFDMSGNIYEICSDWYGSYPTPPSSGANKVLRGGSWLDSFLNSSVYDRSYATPNGNSNITGFRITIQP
ncbi:formylglycine-generating enzyme family protein [Flectobacillus roseus]